MDLLRCKLVQLTSETVTARAVGQLRSRMDLEQNDLHQIFDSVGDADDTGPTLSAERV